MLLPPSIIISILVYPYGMVWYILMTGTAAAQRPPTNTSSQQRAARSDVNHKCQMEFQTLTIAGTFCGRMFGCLCASSEKSKNQKTHIFASETFQPITEFLSFHWTLGDGCDCSRRKWKIELLKSESISVGEGSEIHKILADVMQTAP